MKQKQKTKQKWQIDDLVYFLDDDTEGRGAFRSMLRGTVEEITRDAVRVKIRAGNYENLLWVENDNAYASADELRAAVQAHLEKQAFLVYKPYRSGCDE